MPEFPHLLPSPTWLVALGAVTFALSFLTWRSRGRYVQRPILTDNEKEFFQRLTRALPDHLVLTQVSMSALMEPRARGKTWRQMRAAIAQKYVDFVVCDPSSLSVLALVELDDRTHNPAQDAQRDAMTLQAGYRTVRWHSKRKPSVQQIRETLLGHDITPSPFDSRCLSTYNA